MSFVLVCAHYCIETKNVTHMLINKTLLPAALGLHNGWHHCVRLL
jgi:hypothetical protein